MVSKGIGHKHMVPVKYKYIKMKELTIIKEKRLKLKNVKDF